MAGNIGESYYKYWGKARKNKEGECEYHLLVYHCLDVAAVGRVLLSPESKRCTDIANRMGLSPKHVQYLFTLLMILHDIGKFSKTFQSLIEEFFTKHFSGQKTSLYTERHDTLGFLLWRGDQKNDPNSIHFLLNQKNPFLAQFLELIIRAGTGHHGIPPKESGKGGGSQLRAITFFSAKDFEEASLFICECLEILGTVPDLPNNAKELKMIVNEISWEIAGLGILSDWMGSNTDFFDFCSKPIPLNEYWEKTALPRAEKVVNQVSWSSAQKQKFTDIQTLFPFITTPTPLQLLAERMPLCTGPKLFIIEDVTGSGKTEAALILSSRVMGAGDADGLYLGLPTMATANAMYNRMSDSYRKLYLQNESPSLILSHGARHLSDKFTETVTIKLQKTDQSYGDESSASAYCNLWYADNRKKALLADIGVGTIDQALIGVLPARHQSLRLLGLKRKVLIIDEVHAYDPYMEHLLEVLLEAHARGGGTAILLSATIPQKKRVDLINAFQFGLNGTISNEKIKENVGFPQLTQVGLDTLLTENLDTRKEVKRFLKVDFVHSYESVLSEIIEKAASGECVCWIRNTVKDARKAFHDLLKYGIAREKIDLFHSRFAMIDRTRIEDCTIHNFGKNSGHKERNGRILISTQVVEQSLDLDFDNMISDLAPIDLLIQRAGRLHRHIRDCTGNIKTISEAMDERTAPNLIVYCPEFSEKADSTWLSADFSGTAAVYKNAGVLWRTMRILKEKNGWAMPEDARELIESVYGEGCSFDVPEGLIDKVCNADGIDKSKLSMGHLNALILEKGYCRNAVKVDQWNEDDKIPTRLTEDNYEIALAVVVEGKLYPYAETERFAWDWSCLSVSLRDWKKCGYSLPAEYLKLVEELKNEIHRLKYCEIVIVNCRSNEALAINETISEIYNPRLGWGAAFKEEV